MFVIKLKSDTTRRNFDQRPRSLAQMSIFLDLSLVLFDNLTSENELTQAAYTVILLMFLWLAPYNTNLCSTMFLLFH